MTHQTWMEHAACRDSDPLLFERHDDTTNTRGPYPHETEQALALCATCPTTTACVLWVRPVQSGYTGVAGGIVWSNGRPDRRQPARSQG